MSLSSNPEPIVLPTVGGISLAWEYLDNGAMGVALATIHQSGKIHITDKEKMAGWLGASHPKLVTSGQRLVLVARRDAKISVQEFDLAGNAKDEIFSIPGFAVSQLTLEGDHLKVTTWTRNNGDLWTQYVDLKQKRVVHQPPNVSQHAQVHVAPPRDQTQMSRPSALATNSLLAHRFKVHSGHHEFEGAFLMPQNGRSSPNNKISKTYPVLVDNGMLVIAIRESK